MKRVEVGKSKRKSGFNRKQDVTAEVGFSVHKTFARLPLCSTIIILALSVLSWIVNPAWAKENQIEILAQRYFSQIRWTECETNLLKQITIGEVAYCGARHNEEDQTPEYSGKKRMPFDVDAELIRWLCTDRIAIKLIDPRGIRLHAARIVGQLDLSFATVDFPLTFENSRFDKDINLTRSQLANFILTGGKIRGIAAYNITVHSDFILMNTRAKGEVSLTEANLGGDLDAIGATFKNPGKIALNAATLKALNIYLYNDFSADGTVNLQNARLEGILNANDGTFKNPGKIALNAENLKAAKVSLTGKFNADGEVDLSDATLEGSLDADNGTFKNTGKIALYAANLKAVNVLFTGKFNAGGKVDLWDATLSGDLRVTGGTLKHPDDFALFAENLNASRVFLDQGFSADGEVDLKGAKLDGALNANGGIFKNTGKIALNAENLTATNLFAADFNADGEVNLWGATLEGVLNADRGTLKNAGKIALNAQNLKAANVSFADKFNADGKVDLQGAKLNGDLNADDGTFKNPGQDALNADQFKAANVYFTDGFNAKGKVHLLGATLEGDLVTMGAVFRNPQLTAFDGNRTNVAGDIYFMALTAVGKVDFISAQVKGQFFWEPTHSDRTELDLSHTVVGPLFDRNKQWPQQGHLILDGFIYSRFGDGNTDAQSRIQWLDLQRPKITSAYQRFVAYMCRLFSGEEQRDSEKLHVEFRPQPYEQLAKVLRENGDDAGAKNVLIAMENARWWHGSIGFWDRCWSWILWVTIGYGYELWRVLWFIAGFLILGTLLFFWGYNSEAIVQIDKESTEHFLWFNAFVYSLELFVPLVELHQAKHWGPDPELRQNRPKVPLTLFRPLSKYQLQFGPAFGKHLRWYLWFHVLAGYFFTSMLIAGITGLAQKI